MQVLLATEKSRFWVIPNYTEDLLEQATQIPCIPEPPIKIFGKVCHQRRDIAFYSNSSIGYKYSGTMMPSLPLTGIKMLEELLVKVNTDLGTDFNGILVNRYRNGQKYISAHSDNEKGLSKKKKMVVGIAYGATRTFRIRNKKTKEIVLDYPHVSGTLYGMEGDFQMEFTHEIPIEAVVHEERISFTFRCHDE